MHLYRYKDYNLNKVILEFRKINPEFEELNLKKEQIDVNIDIVKVKSDLKNLMNMYEEGGKTKSDVEAAVIIYEFLKNIDLNHVIDQGVILWLTIELYEYVRFRWGINDIKSERVYPNNKRNTILRLFWGAYLVKGKKVYLERLFSNQDLSVAILEREFFHTNNFIIWFFECMDDNLEIYINQSQSSVDIKLIEKIYADEIESAIKDIISFREYRLLMKIMRAVFSQYFYYEWTKHTFKNMFTICVMEFFNIMSFCLNKYEELGIEKLGIKLDKFKNKIITLNYIPFNFNLYLNKTFRLEILDMETKILQSLEKPKNEAKNDLELDKGDIKKSYEITKWGVNKESENLELFYYDKNDKEQKFTTKLKEFIKILEFLFEEYNQDKFETKLIKDNYKEFAFKEINSTDILNILKILNHEGYLKEINNDSDKKSYEKNNKPDDEFIKKIKYL